MLVVTITESFLLSPVQLPWYYAWFAAWLCLRPHLGLLLLTPLLSLYYLQFHADTHSWSSDYRALVQVAQFAPAWLVLAWEWRRRRHA